MVSECLSCSPSEATAKDIMMQVQRTRKLLDRHGHLIEFGIFSYSFPPFDTCTDIYWKNITANSVYIYVFAIESLKGIYDKKVAQLSRYKMTTAEILAGSYIVLFTGKAKLYQSPSLRWMCPSSFPRKRKVITRPWPVLLLSDWIRTCCEDLQFGGFFFPRWFEVGYVGRCRTYAINILDPTLEDWARFPASFPIPMHSYNASWRWRAWTGQTSNISDIISSYHSMGWPWCSELWEVLWHSFAWFFFLADVKRLVGPK